MHYESAQPGIRSRHEFSAGAHYDPANTSFGPIIGLDEHVVEAGAGFDWHAHRGVHIVSLVLAGALRHESSAGEVLVVEPGPILVQSAGAGVRHRETNASDSEPLRLFQITMLADSTAQPSVRLAHLPELVGRVWIDLATDHDADGAEASMATVLRGSYQDQDGRGYEPGESLRIPRGKRVALGGRGELLVLILFPDRPTVGG